jgi:hypothetical protein
VQVMGRSVLARLPLTICEYEREAWYTTTMKGTVAGLQSHLDIGESHNIHSRLSPETILLFLFLFSTHAFPS